MGAWGALIMSFFGAAFASLTLFWQWHVSGVVLALPFLIFLLIGIAARFRPFHALGMALILAALAGFVLGAPANGVVAGWSAAGALWVAAIIAVRRDGRSKRASI